MKRPAWFRHSVALLPSLVLLSLTPEAWALTLSFADTAVSSDSYTTNYDGFTNYINLQVPTGSATYQGSITGTGPVYKTGAGTLLMTGTYAQQGLTSVRGGKMVLTGQITQTLGVGVGWDNTGGELLLQAGGSITSGPVYIAPFATSGTSIATLDGPTTTWTVVQQGSTAGFVSIGDNNDGSLVIQNGALLSSQHGYIGYRSAGVDGFATVTGANSRWLNSEYLMVGSAGNGNLTISNGGRVENSYARIGEQAGSSGTVLVTGTGSTWASSGDVYVGNGGNGSLTISGGGTVTSVGNAPLADAVGSTGTVSLTGSGSVWMNTGAVTVGNRGTGSLSIADGAKVTVASATVANIAGSTGTLQLDGGSGQGVLETAQLAAGSGTALINWNGGILLATQSRTDFLANFGSGEIDVQAGGAYIDSNGFDIGSNSLLNGAGGLAKSGAGTFTYTGTATLSGITSVNGGSLTVGAGGSYLTGGIGVGREAGMTGTFHVTGTGASLYGGNFITVGDGIGSTGTLTVDGGGTVRMGSGAKLTVGWENAAGTLNLNAGGTLEIGGTNGLQKHATGTSTVNFGGGTLRVVDSALTTALPIALTTGSSTIDTNGLDATLSGALSGAGGLLKTGNGTLTLNAASSYSGGTQLDGGTLRAGVADALATDQNFTVNSGVLDANGFSLQMAQLSGDGGTVSMGNGSLTVNQSTSTTFRGGISGNGNFVKAGTGSLFLRGTSNIAGITSANGGALNISTGGNFTTGGLGVGRLAGSTATVSVSGTGAVLNATNFLTVGDEPNSTGTLTVSSGGRVSMGAGAKLTVGWADATGTLNLNSGGIVEIGGVDGLQKHATGTSTVNFGSGTFRVVHQDLTTSLDMNVTGISSTFDTNDLNATLSGSLTGAGTLKKIGAGDLILNGGVNLTGQIHVNGGGLEIQSQVAANGFSVGRLDNATGSALVAGAGATLNAGSFLTVGDYGGSTGTLTVENGGLVKLNAGGKLAVGWANASGTLNLNSGGTVEIGGADGLQKDASGTTQINFAGGTFRVTNADLTTSLPMTLTGTSSTFDTNGMNATLSGALTGGGSLEKTGAGTLILNAINGHTGGTTVTGGALLVNGAIGDALVKSGALLCGPGTIGDIMLDGGSLAPGALTPGASVGTLTGESLNWKSGPLVFELGPDAASSDLLVLLGGLAGVGDRFDFTFVNNGWQAGLTYELIDFGSTSDILVENFAFTNTDGIDGEFVYDGTSLKFTLAAVPEPGTAALLSIGFAALGFSRRRRAV